MIPLCIPEGALLQLIVGGTSRYLFIGVSQYSATQLWKSTSMYMNVETNTWHSSGLLLSLTDASPTKLSFKSLFRVYLFMWPCIWAKFGKVTVFKSKSVVKCTFFLFLILALYNLYSKQYVHIHPRQSEMQASPRKFVYTLHCCEECPEEVFLIISYSLLITPANYLS